MDRRSYSEYPYMFDPNQQFYSDPSMQQQQGYYAQGPGHYAEWGWQPSPYMVPPQQAQYYGAYPQQVAMGYSYEYNGYENPTSINPSETSRVYDNPQGYDSNNQQDYQGRRSKHSYSQNRSRNRPRNDQKGSWGNNSNNNNSASSGNDNNNSQNDIAESVSNPSNLDSSKYNKSETDVSESSNILEQTSTSNEVSKPIERTRNRGRFQGNDHKTKTFDREKQHYDRRKGFNKQHADNSEHSNLKNVQIFNDPSESAKPPDKDRQPETLNDDQNKSATSDKSEHTYNKGARSKSYRDSRDTRNVNNRSNSRNKSDGHRNDNSKSSDIKDENQSEVQGCGNKTDHYGREYKNQTHGEPRRDGEGKENQGRKKKKEYQQVYSTSSPREWQAKPSPYASQRDAYDRYNYRGQDYNKRHKENPTLGIERGGDRTKLSSNFEGVKDDADGKTDSGKGQSEYDGRKKTSYGGHHRGSRQKKHGPVDESQRGVLIEQLSRGSYECMVCCETVRAQNAIWSCHNCYHVFHLRCIKKWARSPNAVVSGADKDGWRCPACQNLTFVFPNQYRCFCGKVKDPDPSRMDTPHSCGDVCQKDRGEECKHPCNILCHPGPCPECTAMVTKSCDCGKTKQTAKCSQSLTLKCDLVCERQLNCGKHFCQAKCHAGPCQKCEFVTKQECHGGHDSREVVCGSEESFVDSYCCDKLCSKTLDCGNHTCENVCHVGKCESCSQLPQNVTHCPCGSRSLLELGAAERISCLDPVATCDGICNKELKCGPAHKHHRCERTCHEGQCGPCDGDTLLSCRCLAMDREFKCADIEKETGSKDHIFLCDRRCNRKKSCGRHKCGQLCCIKDEHSCEQTCGRKLPCGLHRCSEPCHRNNCPPCLMASFDELTCYCGAEVTFPPVPCGAKPPECHKPCTREHGCDHPVRHSCHSDETCPPCTELIKKMCMGNHVLRSNIPCHLKDISCGMKCSKPLPCGEHTCIRTCHKGACLEEGQACSQPCQRKRETCEHTCAAPCHGENPCPPTQCKAKVQVKCACGHREAESMCSVGMINAENAEYQKLTMQSLKDSIQGIMGASSSVNIGKRMGQHRILECNEECALLERNRRLAQALEIQNPDLSAKLGSPMYSDFLKEYARKDSSFTAGIEKTLSELVQSAKQSKQPSRSHPFPSMNMNQRKVVHELAEFYGCTTQSYDFEPKKNVVATAQKDKSWLPSVTLTTLVQREMHGPRAPPPIPHLYKEEALRMTNLASKQSTLLLGEKDREKSSSPTPEGWQVIGRKTGKKMSNSSSAQKSAIGTIDKFESNLADICATGTINYDSLCDKSKEALKSEPVVDYFDFTVN